MTVNMAEALPQWSSDARHPSEVCDGCTNQTRRATSSPGTLPHRAAPTGCVLLGTVAVQNNSTLLSLEKQKSKLKWEAKQRRRNAKHGLVTSYGTHLTGDLTQQQWMS